MKTLRSVLEGKLTHNDIPWCTADIIAEAMRVFDEEDGSLWCTSFSDNHPTLDIKDIKLLEGYLAWVKYAQTNIRWNPTSVYNAISNINKSHYDSFMGKGSEGLVFDAGNYIIKVFTAPNPKTIRKYLQAWCSCKKILKTIPAIIKHDNDYRWIVMEKVMTPCKEGYWIDNAISMVYHVDEFTNIKHSNNYNKWADSTPTDQCEFVIRWMQDFINDYKTIMGEAPLNDDLRLNNIGKTRDGRVVCFDWCADVIR